MFRLMIVAVIASSFSGPVVGSEREVVSRELKSEVDRLIEDLPRDDRIFAATQLSEDRPSPVVIGGNLYLATRNRGDVLLDAKASYKPKKHQFVVLWGTVEIISVINPTSALVSHDTTDGEPQRYWISGVDTENWIDGEQVSTGDMVFFVRGKKSYPTASGSTSNAWELQCADKMLGEDKFAQLRDLISYRVWSRKDNSDAIIAKYSGRDGTSLRLTDRNNIEHRMDISDAHPDDAKWVRDKLKSDRRKLETNH